MCAVDETRATNIMNLLLHSTEKYKFTLKLKRKKYTQQPAGNVPALKGRCRKFFSESINISYRTHVCFTIIISVATDLQIFK